MTVFEILNLRYEFEELVRKMRLPKDRKAGVLPNLLWMSNSKNNWEKMNQNFSKEDCSRVREICKLILDDEATRIKFV